MLTETKTVIVIDVIKIVKTLQATHTAVSLTSTIGNFNCQNKVVNAVTLVNEQY